MRNNDKLTAPNDANRKRKYVIIKTQQRQKLGRFLLRTFSFGQRERPLEEPSVEYN